MKECACCKARREKQELRATLNQLFVSIDKCTYRDELRLEWIETLTDHAMVLVFNVFYPKEAK